MESDNGLKARQALLEAQKDMGAVAKSGENKYDKYSYANLADYNAVIKPALEAHGLVMYESVVSIKPVEGGRTTSKGNSENAIFVELDVTLAHSSGGVIIVKAAGEGQDRGDKALYKAITGARKYARACLFNLVTTDDPEGDETVGGEVKDTKATGQPKASAKNDDDDGLGL